LASISALGIVLWALEAVGEWANEHVLNLKFGG
jgi:hypothetical protein